MRRTSEIIINRILQGYEPIINELVCTYAPDDETEIELCVNLN